MPKKELTQPAAKKQQGGREANGEGVVMAAERRERVSRAGRGSRWPTVAGGQVR